MFAFVLGAIALVALALAFVLPTLWNGARRSAIALLVAVPLGAAALYAGFGTPDALDPANREVPESIEQAVVQLERRLEREPESLEGWVLLGRTRKNQGRETASAGDFAAAMPHFAAAAAAFRKARDLAPHEPDLLVETAEAISLSNAERAFGPEGTSLLDEALAKVPNHQRALWFRGIAALQAGDGAGAVARWEALLPMVDAATAEALVEQIGGAREAAGLPPMDTALIAAATAARASAPAAADAPQTAAPMANEPAPGTPGTLTVTISAEASALAALPPQAVLFVFARNADAAGPPVAARRVTAARLPITITLSDADRLMPTATLSATSRVEVSARFARSGSVQPEAGDLVAPPVVVELAEAAPISLALAPSDAPTDAARAPTFGP
ncbi:tetratricopeptide repeat protein [Silanimonas sp.]|jgi:cytochrome c-type biogenesis protein CcmH|uniref:tetratricopeptide repeat protein n=1 Tax=Silanimonas sp. TaxID=1929290 RepID=UPI0037CA4AF5